MESTTKPSTPRVSACPRSSMSTCLFVLVGVILGIIIGTTVILAQQQRHLPPNGPHRDPLPRHVYQTGRSHDGPTRLDSLAREHPNWISTSSSQTPLPLDTLQFSVGSNTFSVRAILEEFVRVLQRSDAHESRTTTTSRQRRRSTSTEKPGTVSHSSASHNETKQPEP